ncbi:MAG: hypothetical protein QM750_17310 [Rubrivivax sp.]
MNGRLDAGLRLLVAGRTLLHLRWTTEPDAPAGRALADGEVRLAIHAVDFGAAELNRLQARLLRAEAGGDAGWLVLEAPGLGEVVESRAFGCPVGRILRGPLHLGSHRVLRLAAVDAHGVVTAGPGAAPTPRYAWSAGPLHGPAAQGIDAVEQALQPLRDPAHGPAPALPMRLSVLGSRQGGRDPISLASCLRNRTSHALAPG